jgi:hypothetical protein
VCCASLGTLSAQEMTTGRVSHQQISPLKGEIVIYRSSIGPDSLRDALPAMFVGNHRGPSGESRLKYTRLTFAGCNREMPDGYGTRPHQGTGQMGLASLFSS